MPIVLDTTTGTFTRTEEPVMQDHVILVAVSVTAKTRDQAERYLHLRLPIPSEDLGAVKDPGSPQIESWWIAEDDRRDRSDNDSAVFVHPHTQAEALRVLHKAGLTGSHNLKGGS